MSKRTITTCVSGMDIINSGKLHRLSDADAERARKSSKNGTEYKYCTEGVFKIKFNISRCDEVIPCVVEIPRGFLADGADIVPDYGISWLYHDYLYATHSVNSRSGPVEITRAEADDVMTEILEHESENDDIIGGIYAEGFKIGFEAASSVNLFGLFGKSWKKSGKRGPEFIKK